MSERIDIEIRGKSDSAVAAAQATERALDRVNTQTKGATAAAKDMGSASSKAAGGLEQIQRAGGPASQILNGLTRSASGGMNAVLGLVDATKGLLATFTAGFGPAGLLAVAASVIGGLVAAFGRAKEQAKGAADEIKKLAQAAGDLERAKLEDFNLEYEKLNRQAAAAAKQFEAVLALRRKIADAQTETEIAEVRARRRTGAITADQEGEQVRGLELARTLRNIDDPAQRAARQAQAAQDDVSRARDREAAIAGRASESRFLAGFFNSDIARLQQEIAQLEEARRPKNGAIPDVSERVRIGNEIRQRQREIEQAQANEAAQNARLTEANEALIKATEERAAAEAAAAAATQAATAEIEAARRLSGLATRGSAAAARSSSAGSIGRDRTGRTFDSSTIPAAGGAAPGRGVIEVLDRDGRNVAPSDLAPGTIIIERPSSSAAPGDASQVNRLIASLDTIARRLVIS
jgi:trimeric autotransporter adhesin